MHSSLFLVGTFFVFSHILKAQELPQLAGFMYNQFLYNPAAGGMYDTDLNFRTNARIQWSGLPGAPVTNYTWADYRFAKNSMSAGLCFTYDKIGARSLTDVSGNYTYIVRLSNKLKLSFGLRVGVISTQFNSANVNNVFDADDGRLLAANVSTNAMRFGTGFQLYSKNWYAGIGLPDIVSTQSYYRSDIGKGFFSKNRSYTVLAGYRYKLSDAFSLYPNIKMYYYPTLPFRIDVNLMLEITDYFWTGVSYANTGNTALMAGTYITSGIRFMYAYEFMVGGNANQVNPMSIHEVVLMIQLDNVHTNKRNK
jgi:type IX secretion system PorP/SprF family membrane protein